MSSSSNKCFVTECLIVFRFVGYSIFVAVGQFPECEAEQILCVIPAVQKVKPPLLSETKEKILSGATNSSVQFDDADLKKALEESKRYIDENDESLKRAIALSMESKSNAGLVFDDYLWHELF